MRHLCGICEKELNYADGRIIESCALDTIAHYHKSCYDKSILAEKIKSEEHMICSLCNKDKGRCYQVLAEEGKYTNVCYDCEVLLLKELADKLRGYQLPKAEVSPQEAKPSEEKFEECWYCGWQKRVGIECSCQVSKPPAESIEVEEIEYIETLENMTIVDLSAKVIELVKFCNRLAKEIREIKLKREKGE